MANYCLLMTAQLSTVNGNIDLGANAPYWACPDTGIKSPGAGPTRFLESDNVSVAMRLLGADGVPILPTDFLIAAVITAKKTGGVKNASPYKVGAVSTGNRRPLLLGSISGEGSGVSTLTAFDKDGNSSSWTPSTFSWIGFGYGECLLFHDSGPVDSKFELTLSAQLSGNQQWAYDPEMDVGKRP